MRFDIPMTFFRLIEEIETISTVCPHHNRNDCVWLNVFQKVVTWATMFWFGHSYVGESQFIELGIHSLQNSYQ
jgi:hypothetical protein